MKKIKNRLLHLAMGEFAAICVFIFAYRQASLGVASLITFTYLVFILLQGSMYWLYRYILLVTEQPINAKIVALLKFLRLFNIVLLTSIVVVIFIVNGGFKDYIAALGIFLFGVIEYINYFWYRLSYGKSGFNIRLLLDTGFKKSSINKLLHRTLVD